VEFDGFDWDSGNTHKCQKHGVSVAQIEELFLRTPLVGPDILNSKIERRFRAIGVTEKGRHIFVVFTWRHRDDKRFIRPISARYMHIREVEAHEEKVPRI
jgi:uncharacterized protein